MRSEKNRMKEVLARISSIIMAVNLSRIGFMLIWLMIPAFSMGNDITFTATAKSQVRVGERFQLNFTINAEGKGFRGPEITDFQVLSGPNASTSSSVQIIQGRVQSKVEYVFSYILRANSEGTYTIPAARVTADGKEYVSNTVSIKVLPGSGGSTGSGQSAAGADTKDELFLRASVNNTNPYLGEQVIITYKIYTTISISNINTSKISSFPGYWAKDLFENLREYPQQREVINGKEYMVAEVKKFALFPQRTGEIIIQPGEVSCVAQIRTTGSRSRSSDPFFDSFFNDPFFNSRIQNVEKQLNSNSLKINVKPLPTQNRPADFQGAVGEFSFQPEISATEVNANEPITMKFTLRGKGNLELIDPPVINFPPGFEVYDPETKNNITANASGISGSRSFEYLIIPRNPGDYSIKPATFSFFNPNTNQYRSLSSPEYNIQVNRTTSTSQAITFSGINQEEVQYITRDIRHIKLPPYQLRPINTFFFRSGTYYILLITPLLLSLAIIIFWRRTVKLRNDTAMLKYRKATKVSRKRLKLAGQFLKNKNENAFYEEVSRALWGYLSDKLIIDKASLSVDNVKDVLEKRKVTTNIINQFIETLNHTEYARFAPGNKSENMEKIYNKALAIISKIERELK
jgi:hypothetical protein